MQSRTGSSNNVSSSPEKQSKSALLTSDCIKHCKPELQPFLQCITNLKPMSSLSHLQSSSNDAAPIHDLADSCRHLQKTVTYIESKSLCGEARKTMLCSRQVLTKLCKWRWTMDGVGPVVVSAAKRDSVDGRRSSFHPLPLLLYAVLCFHVGGVEWESAKPRGQIVTHGMVMY